MRACIIKEPTRFAFFTRTFHNGTQLFRALTPFPHAHRHTDQPTDRPPTYTTVYIGFRAFSELLEHPRAFQACRALPAQRHPRHPIQGQDLGHPASASLLLGRLELATARCRLSPTQNTVARQRPATRQAVDTGTFQRPHPFVYDFALARGTTSCLADVI